MNPILLDGTRLSNFVSSDRPTHRRRSGHAVRRRQALRAAIEALETRQLLTAIVVNSIGDSVNDMTIGTTTTLREAVNYENANGGGTILFAPAIAGQTINLEIDGDDTFGPSALAINSDITIDGGDGGITIFQDTGGPLRQFYVTGAGNLTLENLTVSGGSALGGDGQTAGGGGAGLGGAIVSAGSLQLTGDTFTGNEAVGGEGGGGGGSIGNGGGLSGSASSGSFGGGGVAHSTGGFGGGGGGGNSMTGPAGNAGFGGGGGWGYLTTNGTGGFGGGVGGYNGAYRAGGGAGLGGAVFNYGGALTITNSTFANNSAYGGGGGQAGQGLGGAIFNLNGVVTTNDSTIANNIAPQGGGAIYSLGDNGIATQAGPVLPSITANIILNNSILSGSNDGAENLVSDFVQNTNDSGQITGHAAGTVASSGANDIVQTGSVYTIAASVANPDLGALANNGGPTDTFAPAADSPAINAASNALIPTGVMTDQRGYTRVANATVDIGAYEYGAIDLANSLVVTTTVDGFSSAGPVSLRQAVAYAQFLGGSQTITFDPGLTASVPGSIELSIDGDDTFGPSALAIVSDITIDGPTGSNGITITRDATADPTRLRLFYVAGAGDLTLTNLTVSGGLAAGGSSDAGGGGAGLGGAIVNAGILNLLDSTLSNNLAQGGSGGNESDEFGGGGLGGDATGAFGSSYGGGPNGGSPNSGGGFGGGGGIHGGASGPGGFGGGGGGGFNSGSGGFGGGGGSQAGGGFGGGGGLNKGGGGAGFGGAIFNYGGTVAIANSTLANNAAVGGSGSAGAGNGSGLGGAIFNLNGSVTATNATLADNIAAQGAGAIYNLADALVATQAGPTLPNTAAAVILNNTILSGSNNGATTPALVSDFEESSANGGSGLGHLIEVSGSNNIIQTPPQLPPASTNFQGWATQVDPMLGSLANNGGPTQTLALQNGSPAIDAGSNASAIDSTGATLATDQRGTGYSRIADGAVDIGAFELQTTTATTVDPSPLSPTFGQSVSFTADVTNTDGLTPIGSVAFFLDGSTTAFDTETVDGNGQATSIGLSSLSAIEHGVEAVFTPTSFFTASNGSTNVTIAQAMPTISVTDNGGAFDDSAYPATATVNGGTTLESVGLTLDYINADTSADLGSTAPTTAGNYKVTASFPGSTDYASGSNFTTFTIGQAMPMISVGDAGGTYNGSPYTATATVNGGTTLESIGLTLDYIDTDTSADLGSTAPATSGNYKVTASFAGSTDYTSGSGFTTFTIGQATPMISVSDAGGIYTGSAFTAGSQVKGVEAGAMFGSSLEGVSPALVYYAGGTATGTSL
ncbi:MAG TPA: Ig-like domain-containing protein, partial [Tepidisphaeraceae bacterium]|nr:Ig-like domain-containing protein [Tepidisphaeraceae bacterium]